MVSSLFKFLFPVVVIVGVGLWVSREYLSLTPTKVVSPLSLTASAYTVPKGVIEIVGTIQMQGNYQGEGVPYLFFTNEKGATIAKQLIFTDSRGCSPLAGDLPCAGVRDYGAYPALKTDDHVVVSGYVVDDRFFVSKITIL